jgi:hypothetical protein
MPSGHLPSRAGGLLQRPSATATQGLNASRGRFDRERQLPIERRVAAGMT